MGLLGTVAGDFLDECILCYSTLKELCWLEMACTGVYCNVSAGGAWGTALDRELQGIALKDPLRARRTLCKHRRELKELLASVSRVLPVLDKVPMPLANVAEVRELASAVRRAFTVADAHAAACGQAVRVIMSRFHFAGPETAAVPPLGVSHPFAAAEGPTAGAQAEWCISTPMPFTFSTKRSCGGTATAAATSAGEEELALWLAWKGNAVYLNVTPQKQTRGGGRGPAPAASLAAAEPEPCGDAPSLAIDICALGKAPLLRARNTTVRVDGRKWQPVRGIVAGAEFTHAELANALSPGLLCIVCVREAFGPQTSQAPKDAYALHLEASLRSRTPLHR